jgi:hypothetical protein
MPDVPMGRLSARAALLSAAALFVSTACHRGGKPRVVPVDATCGQRSGVAIYRGVTPRRATEKTGALVVRLAPADSGLITPEGPVRIAPAGRDAEARVLQTQPRGIARTGPLPVGRYVVVAQGTGYRPRSFTIAVRPGVTDTLRIRLQAMCVRRT